MKDVRTFEDMRQLFHQSNVVYILLHVYGTAKLNIHLSSTEHYIGSTIHTLHDRQNTRHRKLKQLQNGQPVSCELALHWFCSQGNYYQFVPLPLLTTSSQLQTRTLESYMIQLWCPPLNYPLIMQRKVTKQHSTPHLRQAIANTFLGHGQRLYARLRRRMMYKQVFHFYNHNLSKHTTAWLQLHVLAEQSQRSFDMQKFIRSNSTHSDHLFALYKLSNNMEDPPRTRVRSLIKSAIQFRQLPLPPSPRPLILPLLSHKTFSHQTRHWLRQIAIQHKQWLPPFHIPKCNITAGKHTTMQQALFSHFSWMKKFTWNEPPPCSCQQLFAKHPRLTSTTICDQPHIASPAANLNVPARLANFLATHAGTQVYPTKHHYCQQTWPKLQRWLQHYNINTITYADWQSYIEQQWPQHLQQSKQWIGHSDIQYLRKIMQQFVVHCRDHAATAIFVYCPFLYWTVLKKTFGDSSVYTHLTLTPPQATQYLQQLTHQPWLQKYKWAYNTNSDCPTAYILLKQKKQFLAARPIINYRGFVFEKLLKATAIVLQQMLQACMSKTFGLQSLQQIFYTLHTFFHNAPADLDLAIYNQDLAGFFTSIPADRILHALAKLLKQYQQQHPHVNNDTVFTVDMQQPDTTLRLFRGRPRRAAMTKRQIRFGDIYNICSLSLQASIFSQLQQTFQQFRGSAIGNQISPVLANITVSLTEQDWLNRPQVQQYLHTHSNRILITRYVDNRLVLIDQSQQHHAIIQPFLQDTFYQEPVILEDEPDNSFLGCTIDLQKHTLSYIQPNNAWQFQSFGSAASTQHKLSAAYSRICLAARHSHPYKQAQHDVEFLIQSYVSLGYPYKPLRAMAARMLSIRR